MPKLNEAVRIDIANCSEKAYESLSVKDCAELPIKVQYKTEGKTKGESKKEVESSINGVIFDNGINQLMDIQAFSFCFTKSCFPAIERKTDDINILILSPACRHSFQLIKSRTQPSQRSIIVDDYHIYPSLLPDSIIFHFRHRTKPNSLKLYN